MKLLDLTAEAAEDALVQIALHTGPKITIGRPVLAWRGGDTIVIITESGEDPIMWEVGCCFADQTITADERRTIIRWRRGVAVDVVFE